MLMKLTIGNGPFIFFSLFEVEITLNQSYKKIVLSNKYLIKHLKVYKIGVYMVYSLCYMSAKNKLDHLCNKK